MKTFNDRYPEVGDRDIDLAPVVTDLERMGQRSRFSSVSPQQEARILYALRERAAERGRTGSSHQSPRSLFAQHRVRALTLVVTVSAAMIAGGAYATISTLGRVFQMGVANNVTTQDLGTRVDQSQTLAGYTMTVERAYADANRVLIAYTIRPPANGKRQWNLTPDNLQVVTASGVELPNRGYVVAGDSGQPDATLQMFDGAGITGDPKTLHLRLTVPWIDGMEDLPAPTTPQEAPGGNNGELPTSGPYGSIATDPTNRPTGIQDPYMHDFRVFGPLTFNITVPFAAGREIAPHQQVHAGGVTLTLERVVISPTETRAYISGLTPQQSHYVHGTLSGERWTDEDIDGGSTAVWYSDGMAAFSYLGDFTDKHGAWTFTVKPAPGAAGSAPAGPWTFQFNAP